MFNVSERQLFCIARAILIKSTILVYDEPSITVDIDTDRLIHLVILQNFSHCTLIFLATRFRVICSMDKVMVMKHGSVVEFDTPLALLDDPKSKFSLMLSQTGDVDPSYLRSLAQKQFASKSNSTSTDSVLPSSSSMRSSRNSTPKRLEELFQGMSKGQTNGSEDSIDAESHGSSVLLLKPLPDEN